MSVSLCLWTAFRISHMIPIFCRGYSPHFHSHGITHRSPIEAPNQHSLKPDLGLRSYRFFVLGILNLSVNTAKQCVVTLSISSFWATSYLSSLKLPLFGPESWYPWVWLYYYLCRLIKRRPPQKLFRVYYGLPSPNTISQPWTDECFLWSEYLIQGRN